MRFVITELTYLQYHELTIEETKLQRKKINETNNKKLRKNFTNQMTTELKES